jgi:hypothetical protein
LLGLRCLLLARPHDELLLLTSQGRGLKVQLSDICLLTDGGGWPFDPSTEHRPGTGLRTGRAPGLLEPGALYPVLAVQDKCRTVQYGAQGPRAQAQGPLVLRHCTERSSTVPKDEGQRAQGPYAIRNTQYVSKEQIP